MSFTVIIPARYASTRFPGKPLIDLGGEPMVVRVAKRAAQSHARQVVVATDDARIEAVCKAHDVRSVMTSTTHATGTDRLSEASTLLKLDKNEIVVNVQGDEPLIPIAVIDQVADLLRAHPEASIATASHPIHSVDEFLNPNAVKVVTSAQGEALYFSRAPMPWPRDAFASSRHDLPAGLNPQRHIGLYAYRVGFLSRYPNLPPSPLEAWECLEQLRALAHGERIQVMQLGDALPPGIDTPEDYQRLRGQFA